MSTLVSLCLLSSDYTNASRKHLYRELDLTDTQAPYNQTHHGMLLGRLTPSNLEMRIRIIEANPHLWKHIQSLLITLDDASNIENSANTFFIQTLKALEPHLSSIRHLYIQFGPNACSTKYHFRILEPARRLLERCLSSEHLESMSIEINTQRSEGSPFPEWIFRQLSSTVTKLVIHTPFTSGALFPGDFNSLSKFNSPSEPRRYISEFEFATMMRLPATNRVDEDAVDFEDSILRCCAILSSLCFNLDFSQTKRLKMVPIWHGEACEPTLWDLPDKARPSLEELTIDDFPSECLHCSLSQNLLMMY